MLIDQKSLQYAFAQRYLKLHHRRYLELLKHYDKSMLYHLGKFNIVEDAFSKLSMGSVAYLKDDKELVRKVYQLSRLGVRLVDLFNGSTWVQNGSNLH